MLPRILRCNSECPIHSKTAIFNRPIQGGFAHQKHYARVQPGHSVLQVYMEQTTAHQILPFWTTAFLGEISSFACCPHPKFLDGWLVFHLLFPPPAFNHNLSFLLWGFEVCSFHCSLRLSFDYKSCSDVWSSPPTAALVWCFFWL